MELIDVVHKLVGPIDPVGETNEDHRRLENLKSAISVVGKLLEDIRDVAVKKSSYQASVQLAGKTADRFLTEIATGEYF